MDIKNKKIKVSIIVPVYNVEMYITECLNSAINQSLKEIEIICINDGSTDKSGEILNNYEKKDNRVIVIHKENSGYGHSINMGFKRAMGDYIAILESDDKIAKDMYKNLYEIAVEMDVDVIKSDYYEFYHCPNGSEVIKYSSLLSDKSYYNAIINQNFDISLYHETSANWTGLYKRIFLNNQNILHNESPGASYQDVGFKFQVYMKAKRIIFVDKAFYMYRIDNPNSSVHNKEKEFILFQEYDFIRGKIDEMGKEGEKFIPIYIYLRLHGGRYTLKRVAQDKRESVAARLRQDYLEALINGEIQSDFFDTFLKNDLFEISANPIQYCEKLLFAENSVLEYTKQFDKIIVYGAGIMGNKIYYILKQVNEHIKIISFAVSEYTNNPKTQHGIIVKEISELVEYKDKALVIIAVTNKQYDEMEAKLKELKFSIYIFADCIMTI